MNVEMKIINQGTIQAKLEATLSLSEWEVIMKSLAEAKFSMVSHEFIMAISNVINQTKQNVYYDPDGDKSDGD